MSKPHIDSRRRLAVAGMETHDALDVVNEFYQNPDDADYSVCSEWWQIRVCILAERIAVAEKHREELREQNRRLILAGAEMVEAIQTLRNGDGGLVSPALVTLEKAMKWQSR